MLQGSATEAQLICQVDTRAQATDHGGGVRGSGCFVTRNRASWESNTAIINSHLIQCCSEVEKWTVFIELICNEQSARRKVVDMFQKRRQRELSNIEAKLERHRLRFGLDIGTLNVLTSSLGLKTLDAVQTDIKELTESNLKLNATNQTCSKTMIKESKDGFSDLKKQIYGYSEAHLARSTKMQQKTRSQISEVESDNFDFADQASHMVEKHKIASCDQDACYKDIADFKEHLIHNHFARADLMDSDIPLDHRRRFRKAADETPDVRIESISGTTDTPDLQTTHSILQFQIESILSRSPYSQTKQYEDVSSRKESYKPSGKTSATLRLAMGALAEHAFSSPTPSAEMVDLLLQAAKKEEEMSIDCNRSFEQWAPIPKCLLQKAPIDEKAGFSDNADQMVVRERSAHLPSSYFEYSSKFLLFNSPPDYVGPPEDANVGMNRFTEIVRTETVHWDSLDPSLRITSLFCRLIDWKNRAEWMDLWMLNILHKSQHLRTFLCCTKFAPDNGGSIEAPSEREVEKFHGETQKPQFGGRRWLPDILDAFEMSVQNRGDRAHVAETDGAVDSRDGMGSQYISIAAMEAFSAAASVAGLLSLSGQILGGLFKLGQHIQDVRELGDRTENFGKETELLMKTVTELESILRRLQGG
ncbi:hypothetical protein CSOJ01_05238 [Colletotrichum sojae]|uniref:Uncharacterized protein n=1 Tax=Colletotrichum sojae TaxID=2175907 RepID=A0A8H6JFM8_9PEZI|nr:hypothetical protein CSOJ01_05238 [Colletotrichum sojae]